jgi:hypothetical protein
MREECASRASITCFALSRHNWRGCRARSFILCIYVLVPRTVACRKRVCKDYFAITRKCGPEATRVVLRSKKSATYLKQSWYHYYLLLMCGGPERSRLTVTKIGRIFSPFSLAQKRTEWRSSSSDCPGQTRRVRYSSILWTFGLARRILQSAFRRTFDPMRKVGSASSAEISSAENCVTIPTIHSRCQQIERILSDRAWAPLMIAGR